MSDTVRVYINAKPVDAPSGCSALDAVALLDSSAADEIRSGARGLTDSRGLPVEADVPVERGAIFRVVRRRGAAPDATPDAG